MIISVDLMLRTNRCTFVLLVEAPLELLVLE